jgi:LPXTG-motif cell wall-anchored protein
MGISRAWPRLFSAFLGVAAVAAVWSPGAASAATVNCQPGSGPPCQQAFFQIDKTTGKVVAAVAIPGGNHEGADYDGLDCQTGGSGHCFLAADHTGFQLMNFSAFTCGNPTTDLTAIGASAPSTINAMAYDKGNGKLYAVIGSQLKVVDQSTGVMTDTSSWLGVAAGASGSEELAHVTALTFDPATGNLFGVESRGSRPAVLFKIDAATGSVIHDGFGAGVDYIEIAPVGGRNDVYGIVVSGGTMYATMSLNDADPHLATVDMGSGATHDIGSEGVTLVEGLTTDSTGNLYALSGSGGAVVGTLPCPTPTTPAVVKPATVVAPIVADVPASQVLGLQASKPGTSSKPILPVTGVNTMPMVVLAAACLVLGAGALTLSKKQKEQE